MSFTSFLKTFGLDVLKGAQILLGVAPAASAVIGAQNAAVGAQIDKFDSMLAAGLNIEAIFATVFGPDQKTGQAKLAALIPQIQQIVTSSTILTGKQVKDQPTFSKGIAEIAQGVIDVMNGVEGSAQTVDNVKNVPQLKPANLTLDVTPTSVTTTTKPVSSAS